MVSGVYVKSTQEILNEKIAALAKKMSDKRAELLNDLSISIKMTKTGKTREEIMKAEATVEGLFEDVKRLNGEIHMLTLQLRASEEKFKKYMGFNFAKYALNDELNEYSLDDLIQYHPDVIYAVYYYTENGYDGDGQIIIKTAGNKFYFKDLSHCSCYGPLDGGGQLTNLDIILNSDDIHDLDVMECIRMKIRELEGVQ